MTVHYDADEGRSAVSYGPADDDAWVLAVTCDGERVEITFDEQAMYELWVEVRDVPWPVRADSKEDRLVRQLIYAANGADREMLEDALEALGVPL